MKPFSKFPLPTKKKDDDALGVEITELETERSVHYTYLDGFRLGFGMFTGLIFGLLILGALAWGAYYFLHLSF